MRCLHTNMKLLCVGLWLFILTADKILICAITFYKGDPGDLGALTNRFEEEIKSRSKRSFLAFPSGTRCSLNHRLNIPGFSRFDGNISKC